MPTYPISAPPVAPLSERIALTPKVNYIESPLSGAQVSTTLGFSQWSLTLDFPPVPLSVARQFMAWLNSLQGSVGNFTYQPRGSGLALTGKTLNSAANATTSVINVGGWTSGQLSGVTSGDYVTIGGQFFQITSAPTTANSSGICTLEIMPPVRTTITSGTACNFATPTLTVRISAGGEGQLAMSHDPDSCTLPSLNCIEVR